MDEQENRVEVEIFGEYYIIKGKEPPEYIRMLAQYVNKRMRQVATRNPRLDITRVAVLTALNIADELMKLQREYDELAALLESDRPLSPAGDKKERAEEQLAGEGSK